MLAAQFIVLVIIGVVSANVHYPLGWQKITDNRENYEDVDYFDCTGRPDGLHLHPFDCTRFIQCGNQRSFDMACPLCDQNTGRCPREWLQFSVPLQRCEWDDVAGCHTGDPGTTAEPPVETTAEPPVETTAEPPVETTANPNDPRCPVNCEFQGVDCECGKFYQCRDGTYYEYVCPEGLHFNKDTLQCDLPEHAGCNLNPDTCCKCEYLATGDCDAAYIFQDHDRSKNYEGDADCVRENRSCANNLVWNPAANNADGACDFKSNVQACPKK